MAEAEKPRRRYTKSLRRRRAILDAAIPMLAAHGYHGLSMRELAEAVGLTQSGLLHHFATKEDLVRAVLDERTRRSGAGITEFRDIEPTRIMIRNAAAHPELTRLYLAMVGEASAPAHPMHEYFVRDFHWKRRTFAFGFSLARLLGQVRTDLDSRLLAGWLITLMDGLQTQWLYEPGMDLVAEYDRLLLEMAPLVGASPQIMAKLRRYNGLDDGDPSQSEP
jgi:AcrR family transcriptional regulator